MGLQAAHKPAHRHEGGGGGVGAVTGGIRTSGAGAVATGGGGLWRLPDELDA